MGIVSSKLPEFAGFGVSYDPSAKPYFVSNVLEDMRRIASKSIGRKLIDDIAAASPRARVASAISAPEIKAIAFIDGVNVMITPTSMTFTQSGYKMDWTGKGMEKGMFKSSAAKHNLKDCPYHPAGGSNAEAADIMAAGDGTGSVSIMKYTNAQIMTGKGEATHSFLVLAHELIHSFHHVTGTRRNTDEEKWTTGLPPYDKEPMTENAFRIAFGIKLRDNY